MGVLQVQESWLGFLGCFPYGRVGSGNDTKTFFTKVLLSSGVVRFIDLIV